MNIFRLRQGALSGAISFALACFIFIFPLAMDSAFLNSFEFPKYLLLRAGVTLFGLLWMLSIYRRGELTLHFSSAKIIWLSFIIVSMVSALTSERIHTALFGRYPLYTGFFTFVSVFFLFWFISEMFDDQASLKILRHFLPSSLIVAAYAVAQRIGFDFGRFAGEGGGRSFSTWGSPINLGGFLAFSVFIALGFTFVAERRAEKIWSAGVVVVSLTALLFSMTRGAWIGFAVGLAAFAVVERKSLYQQKRVLLIMIMLFIVIIIAVGIWIDMPYSLMQHFTFRGPSGASLTNRWALWKESLPLLIEKPILGNGLDTFAFRSLFDDKAHNFLIDLTYGTGFVGLVLFVLGFFMLIRNAVINLVEMPPTPGRHILAGILAGLIALMTHLQFAWMTLGLLTIMFVFGGFLEGAVNKKPDAKISFKIIPQVAIAGIICLMVSSGVYLLFLRSVARSEYAFGQGVEYRNHRSYNEAAIDFDEAVRLNPREPFYWEHLAEARYFSVIGSENPAESSVLEAITAAQKSIKVNQGSGFSYVYLISLYHIMSGHDKGYLEKAENAFEEMLRDDLRDRNIVDNYIVVGRIFASYNNPKLARKAFYKALELRPGHKEAIEGLEQIEKR